MGGFQGASVTAPVLLMKGGIPRKGLVAHWQNSDVSSQIIVVSTFLSTLALVGAFKLRTEF
jgi:hypothetical protein